VWGQEDADGGPAGRAAQGQAAVDRRLHAGRQPVGRPLEAGQVEQHGLPAGAVDDGGDPAPGRLGARRDGGHLGPGERAAPPRDSPRLAPRPNCPRPGSCYAESVNPST